MAKAETTRSKIGKVNATINSLMREMQETADLDPNYLDWGELINKLKQYRSDLEDDLIVEQGNSESPSPEIQTENTPDDTGQLPLFPEWNSALERKYMEDEDSYTREDFLNKHGIEKNFIIGDDDEGFILDPDDDDLLSNVDDDDGE